MRFSLGGLREVLRLYGGNRAMLEPANALIARVTGVFGPIIVVAFNFSNALDVEVFRSYAYPTDVVCVAGVPQGVWTNALLSVIAVIAILLIPLVGRRWQLGRSAAAMIGHVTLGFTVAVAVWTAAFVPFLPAEIVGGAVMEHIIVGISAGGAVTFGAAAWLSRARPARGESD